MSKFICKLCDSDLENERLLKKHARKVHDCSIFAAMNPSLISGEVCKEQITRVLALNDDLNQHIKVEDRHTVLYKGIWTPINKIPESLRDYARSISEKIETAKVEPTKVIISKEGNTMTDHRNPADINIGDNDNVITVEPAPKVKKEIVPPVIVSYSMVKSFLDCQQSWYYSYIKKIVPRITNPKLDKGTLVHKAIEAAWHAVHDIPFSKENAKLVRVKSSKAMLNAVQTALGNYIDNNLLVQEEVDLAEETAVTALAVSRKAFKAIYAKYKPVDIAGLPAVEYQFTIPIKKVAKFHGTIDFIAEERKTGLIWLIDWKVRSAFTPSVNQEYNLQMASYQYALLQLGVETAGSITYEIWHEPPNEPELLANKKALSKSAIRTDWNTYKAAIEKHGFKESDYLDMKEKLKAVKWVNECAAYRNTNEIVKTWELVMLPAIESLVKVVRDTKKTFNPQRVICSLNTACPNCSYNQLCLEELRGNDVSEILEDFVPNRYLDKYEEMV